MKLETTAGADSHVELRVIRNRNVIGGWEGGNAVTANFHNACAQAMVGQELDYPNYFKVTPTSDSVATPITITSGGVTTPGGGKIVFTGSTTGVTTDDAGESFSATLQYGTNALNIWANTTGTISQRLYSGDTLEVTWQFTITSLTVAGNEMVAHGLKNYDNTEVSEGVVAAGVATAVNSAGVISNRVDAGGFSVSASGTTVNAIGNYPATAGGDPYPSTGTAGTYYNVGYMYSHTSGAIQVAAASFAISNAQTAQDRRATIDYQVSFT